MNSRDAVKEVKNCSLGIRKDWINDFKALFDSSSNTLNGIYKLFIDYATHQLYEQILYKSDVNTVELDIAPIGKLTFKLKDGDDYVFSVENIELDAEFVSEMINTIECPKSKIYTNVYGTVIDDLYDRLKQFSGGDS